MVHPLAHQVRSSLKTADPAGSGHTVEYRIQSGSSAREGIGLWEW